jgi:hypothetical protein
LPIQANFTGTFPEISGRSAARNGISSAKTLIFHNRHDGMKSALLAMSAL